MLERSKQGRWGGEHGAGDWGWNPRELSGGSWDPEERFGDGQSPRGSDQDGF